MLPLQYLYKTCILPHTSLHTTFQDSKLHSTLLVPQHGHERLPYTPPVGNHGVGFVVQRHNVYTSFIEKSVNWPKSCNGWAESGNVILGDNHFRSTKISNMSHLILHLIWVFTINQNQSEKPVTITRRKSWYCAFHQT
jgi:hypothetical protein